MLRVCCTDHDPDLFPTKCLEPGPPNHNPLPQHQHPHPVIGPERNPTDRHPKLHLPVLTSHQHPLPHLLHNPVPHHDPHPFNSKVPHPNNNKGPLQQRQLVSGSVTGRI